MKVEMKNAYKVQLDEDEYDTLEETQGIIDAIYQDAKQYLSEDDESLFCAIEGAFETIMEWIEEYH